MSRVIWLFFPPFKNRLELNHGLGNSWRTSGFESRTLEVAIRLWSWWFGGLVFCYSEDGSLIVDRDGRYLKVVASDRLGW